MIEQRQSVVPRSVAAAALIFLLVTAIQVAQMLTSDSSRATGLRVAIYVVGVAVLALAAAYGLWRRVERARTLAVGLSGFGIAYGVVGFAEIDALWLSRMAGSAVVVGLLLVPASSRRWFRVAPPTD
ncbi:hypothetical protein [Micromonospora sp. NPDC051296]|uniref:hypothetical protein n=1 Tax=Micromonospora sp. NPDC051296 TaxID=3155046 RepID=UPI0034159026